jgi:outer membrane biosynthesis protein TonB
VDSSFEGLLLSIFLHGLLVWLLLHAKLPAVSFPTSKPTEITIVERDKTQKAHTVVTEVQKKDPQKDFKDEADYLSQFTKRVKKQMKARNNGPTVNTQSQELKLNPPEKQAQPKAVAGLTRPQDTRSGETSNNALDSRPQSFMVSSVAEHLPGIQDGEFTLLNTDQFTYYAFYNRMGEQVRNRWVMQKDLEELSKINRQTAGEIVLSPEGEILGSHVYHSSGDKALDLISVEAFKAAAPFLNPPRGMIRADGNIHINYSFVVQFRPSFGPATN